MAPSLFVLKLLTRLANVPFRTGGILDIPLEEYAENVSSAPVVNLFRTYARSQKNPTLRSVLGDVRFVRWVELLGRSPLRSDLERELETVRGVTEEEDILDDRPVVATEALPPTHTLRTWAEETGVAARLSDPAAALLGRATEDLRRALRNLGRITVGDVFDGPLGNLYGRELPPRLRQGLTSLAEAYVRDAGERVLADRREDARIAELAHVPDGAAALQFVAALDAAIGRLPPSRRRAPDLMLERATFERDPVRVEVQASMPPDPRGRSRIATSSLVLDDWQTQPLEERVRGASKEGRTTDAVRLVLRTVRRVLGDPKHAVHAPLVAYLNEPPWTRVLANITSLTTALAVDHGQAATYVEWQVTTEAEGGIRIVPLVRSAHSGGSEPLRPSSAEALVRDDLGAISARDEAVARALWTAPPKYQSHPHHAAGATPADTRERTYRALALLVGHEGVRGPKDERLRVREGLLGVTLEQIDEGFRFAFDVDGEPIAAPLLREDLDAAGYLLHVDLTRGCILLAHVGTRRAAAMTAMASESALFPEASGRALVGQIIELENLVPIVLPRSLAGDPVEADPRPLVRVVRNGISALSVSWLVRPIPGGPTFPVGRGTTQVLQQVAGKPVFATRSFDDEHARSEALRSRLPASIATGPLTDAPCMGLDEVIEVIELLRAASESGEAVVEWPKTLPRVIGSASWSKLRLQVTARKDWFGLQGTVEIDGTSVPLAALLTARRQGDRYVVAAPDKLIELEGELRARLEELDSIARPSKNGLEVVNVAVPSLVELLDSREQLDAVPAFWSLLARIDEARDSEPKPPRAFAKILRSYQVDGFRWMSRLAAWGAGACLADEMGLGKTVQTLAVLVARSSEGPALVIAPTSVGPNWLAEAKRFAPTMNALLHRGADRASTIAKLGPNDLLVTSYELLTRDATSLSKVTFATLVLDEAQAIKNHGTARARAARGLRADFRLALTGTPVENRLGELYSLMEFLNPGFFGTEEEFRTRFVVPIERDKNPIQSAALANLVRPFLLRRRKAEVLSELPARTEVTRTVERSAAERELYEAARRHALDALADGSEDGRFRILAEIMRLRRLACHPRLDDESSSVPSSKLETFLSLVSELREAGHRALVFSQFTGHLALVQEALRAHAVPYLYLDGKTPVAERTRRVEAFQAGEGALFLISLKAGGTGLNLTAADTVIHLDPWWNPAVEDQATDRAHRIGQTRPVTVVRLIAQGTIEEAVLALHDDKRQLAESILEGSAASGKLSIAELGDLIRSGAADTL